MRISIMALVAAASASAQTVTTVPEAELPPSRFEIGLPVEATLVGLTFGVRPEGLFRFGEPGTASRLRAAIGFFGGPDHFFLPVSLGYRAVYRQGGMVHPLLGAGLEFQGRFVSDLSPVLAFGAYLEGGVGFEFAPGWVAGAMLETNVMVLGTPGFGFGPRAFISFRL